MKYIIIQARNIANLDELEEHLDNWSRHANANVRKWIYSQLRNYFLNKYSVLEPVVIPKADSPEWLKKAIREKQKVFNLNILPAIVNQFFHVIDFLNTLPETRNINYSVDDAIRAARMWDEQRQREIKKQGEAKLLLMKEDGIETIKKYSDGFSWVKVFGEKSLDREGKLMDHCVGSYYKQVKEDKSQIYSLRDERNKPHCTIEISDRVIEQIKGYKNGPISNKYIKYVLSFINKKLGKAVDINVSEIANAHLVYSDKGIAYSLFKLPKKLTVGTDLYLYDKGIKRLCEDLTVLGNLDISSMPDLEELPDTLVVMGAFNMGFGSKIKKLPKHLTVHGAFTCGRLVTELPKDINVQHLEISNTQITSIPVGTYKNLFLRGTNITELPEGLHVKEHLDARGSKLIKLPNKLIVGQSLILDQCNITSIPDTVKIGGAIGLVNSKIKQLPDNWIVNGDLNISDTDIEALPKNLVVKKSLYAVFTKLTTIPSELKVRHRLDLHACPLEYLPEDFVCLGSLILSHTTLKKLPKSLTVMGNLAIQGTEINSLPEDLIVKGYISVSPLDIHRFSKYTDRYKIVQEP